MAAEEMEQHQQQQYSQQWPTSINVPPGYRFKPTPRELIECYLSPWVSTPPGHQSPGELYGIMAAADVYGSHPSALTSRSHQRHDDGNWYFLSVSHWKDGNPASKRMNRTVVGEGGGGGEFGTWHGSGKKIRVRGGGGGYYRQGFEFRLPGGRKTEWLMEEFGDEGNEAAKSKEGVKVLCRIHLRPKAAADERKHHQQQQFEAAANNGPAAMAAAAAAAGNKRQRQSAAAPPHDFGADYWPPPGPDVGCSSSYAIATTSSSQASAAAAALAVVNDDELTAEEAMAAAAWQHQPMMMMPEMEQQAGDDGGCYQYQYHCGGGEPRPLEMVVTADGGGGGVEFTVEEEFKLKPCEYVFSADQLLQLNEDDGGWFMDSVSSDAYLSFFEQPVSDAGVQQESNDGLKPEPSECCGVQENNDGLKLEPSDGGGGVLDDPKPKRRRH